MATIFRTTSGGTLGTTVSLDVGDEFILADGVQIYSEGASVIRGAADNSLFLSANSSVIGFSIFSFAPAIVLGSDSGNSDLFVAETASVWSDGLAVRTLNDFTTVTNAGTITGRSAGIDSQGSNNVIVNTGEILCINAIGARVFAEGLIDNSGTISGRSFGAVTRDGNGTILNSGTISGRTAVFMQGDGTTNDSQLINSGDILGGTTCVFVENSSIQIVNTGTISSTGEGFGTDATIAHSNPANVFLSILDNAGTITSGNAAYRGTNGVDRIDNSGSIQGDILTYDGVDNINNSGEILGDVDLGDGADIYRVTGTGQTNGLVMAGTGDDTVRGGIFDDSIDGGDGADVIRGHGGDDSITGGAQLDTISGGDGNDTLRGEASAGLLLGDAGNDLVDGGNGRDYLYGGSGDDTVLGGAKDDLLSGGSGDDSLDAGANVDTVKGGSGDDTLLGGNGEDQLYGGSDDDLLLGDQDADILKGGRGADTLNGGADADVLTGGQDADVFEFLSASDSTSNASDVITDFTQGVDRIDLSAFNLVFVGDSGFSGSGKASARAMRDNILDESEIRIDTDGDGTLDARIFLEGAVTLVESDFIL